MVQNETFSIGVNGAFSFQSQSDAVHQQRDVHATGIRGGGGEALRTATHLRGKRWEYDLVIAVQITNRLERRITERE